MHTRSIFLFHRDLRLIDNTGLLAALEQSKEVIPCFILDQRQITPHAYQSQHALQFMVGCLKDLDAQLRSKGSHLHLFAGETATIIRRIIAEEKIEAVYSNKDYTPFSAMRDEAIRKACDTAKIPFSVWGDALLHEPGEIAKDDGKPYTVFTPFFRKAQQKPVRQPRENTHTHYASKQLFAEQPIALLDTLVDKPNDKLLLKGGRTEGLKLLKKAAKLTAYKQQRDIPALGATSLLSAHHKFGTISVRETFHKVAQSLGSDHALIAEIHWRDFFTHIAHHFPHVFGQPFDKRYAQVRWNDDEKMFKAWCEGMTGFPIVDAGMRELKATGYMHNRVRMVVASFLTKDLHIDWRKGERYFAQQLIDYDPCVNNGNWQWAASTGCDAQPYFRIFNPWLQQERFDAECVYVKRWIGELKGFAAKDIHRHAKSPLTGYPKPIVDHSVESRIAIDRYKTALAR